MVPVLLKLFLRSTSYITISFASAELCIWISSRPEAFYKPELALFAWRYGFFRSQKTFTSHNPTSSGFRFDWDFFSLLPPLQLGGSALAVFWRNRPIPVDDKDEFKEWNPWCTLFSLFASTKKTFCLVLRGLEKFCSQVIIPSFAHRNGLKMQ